jgi:4-hydroxybenzoate polyprenyltransferase
MTSSSLAAASCARTSATRYLSCLRPQEILVLQGSPLLGAAFALRHAGLEPLAPVAILTLANVCLVAHVFVINDCVNVNADRIDPARAPRLFTSRGVAPREMGGLAAGLLTLSLLLFSTLGPAVFCTAVGIAALSALYSVPPFNWKGRPIFSSAAHLAGGVLHFLLGYGVAGTLDGRGLAIGTFFGLTFVAGHLSQELRDYEVDAENGVRTNAVRFGQRRTLLASLALFTLAQAVLCVLAVRGVVPGVLAAIVLLYPFHLQWSLRALAEGLTSPSISRFQARYRTLHAIIGVAIVAALWFE